MGQLIISEFERLWARWSIRLLTVEFISNRNISMDTQPQ